MAQTYGQAIGQGVSNTGNALLDALLTGSQVTRDSGMNAVGGMGQAIGQNIPGALNTPVGQNAMPQLLNDVAKKVLIKRLTAHAEQTPDDVLAFHAGGGHMDPNAGASGSFAAPSPQASQPTPQIAQNSQPNPQSQPQAQEQGQPQNLDVKSPFSGPLGILKAIMPYPFAMPDLMNMKYQQMYGQTPQGLVNTKKAENALPLSTEQQSTREIGVYSAKRETAQNNLTDLHQQMSDLNAQEQAAHAEATASMSTTGFGGKTFGRQDIMDTLSTKLTNIQKKRIDISRQINRASGSLRNLLANAPSSSAGASGQQGLPFQHEAPKGATGYDTSKGKWVF